MLARVQAEELKLIDAASLIGMSYRQAKRIGKRYVSGRRDNSIRDLAPFWQSKNFLLVQKLGQVTSFDSLYPGLGLGKATHGTTP